MRIKLIAVHKTDKEIYEKPLNHYKKRLSTLCDFEFIEIPGLKQGHCYAESEIKRREAELILQKLKKNEPFYLLDEKGKHYTSETLARLIAHAMLHSQTCLVFVIGGAFGFDPELYDKAVGKISLSSLTLPHQLARLVLVEQLYRCMTIIKGHPYHHR